MVAIEAIGLTKKMLVEAVMRMAFMGKYERMDAERAWLGMIPRSSILRNDFANANSARPLRRTVPGHGRNEEGAVGRPRTRTHRCCKAGAQHLVSMGHPDQNEGPMALGEKRDPNWQPLS